MGAQASPEDKVPRVFDPFYWFDGRRKSEAGGARLGLAIAKWAIDMGGEAIANDFNGKLPRQRREILSAKTMTSC